MSIPTKIKEKAAGAVPPAIRLVQAFHQAVESSQRSLDPIQEAIRLEALIIAAEASYSALSRFAELWHRVTYGEDPSEDVGEEQRILDGYETWLEGADPIFDQLVRLDESQFESSSGERFPFQREEAHTILKDARNRRRIEREALDVEGLANLLMKPRVLRTSYDEPEPSS